MIGRILIIALCVLGACSSPVSNVDNAYNSVGLKITDIEGNSLLTSIVEIIRALFKAYNQAIKDLVVKTQERIDRLLQKLADMGIKIDLTRLKEIIRNSKLMTSLRKHIDDLIKHFECISTNIISQISTIGNGFLACHNTNYNIFKLIKLILPKWEPLIKNIACAVFGSYRVLWDTYTTCAIPASSSIDNTTESFRQIEITFSSSSAKPSPDIGELNWVFVENVIETIDEIFNSLQAHGSLTPTQIDNIADILHQIEGIINIDFIQPNASLSRTNIQSIFEDVMNIHSLKVVPETHLSEGVINVPVVIDAVDKIQTVDGTLEVRATLSSTEV